MKKAKIMAVALALGLAVSFTGCNMLGNKGETTAAETTAAETTAEETTTEETTAEETTAAETTAEETTTEETTAEETTAAETTAEETTAAETTAAETTAAETSAEDTTAAETSAEETTAAETQAQNTDGKKYVDFDDMHFYVNGKKYTLGKTTLQELIDDGVPFDENDLPNAENNVKPNHVSENFRIRLDKYWSALVSTINATDENKKANELVINEIAFPNKPDQKQDILSFEFPIDLKQEDLVAVEGKPEGDNGEYKNYSDEDKKYVTDTYKYYKKSEKYYGNNSFIFEFVNGDLNRITMEYRP